MAKEKKPPKPQSVGWEKILIGVQFNTYHAFGDRITSLGQLIMAEEKLGEIKIKLPKDLLDLKARLQAEASTKPGRGAVITAGLTKTPTVSKTRQITISVGQPEHYPFAKAGDKVMVVYEKGRIVITPAKA